MLGKQILNGFKQIKTLLAPFFIYIIATLLIKKIKYFVHKMSHVIIQINKNLCVAC